MRRLNLLRNVSSDQSAWARHQQAEIEKHLGAGTAVRPLFPGSMLFDHIMCPVDHALPIEEMPSSSAVASEVVYRYCSEIREDSIFDNAVLIDTGSNLSIESIGALLEVVPSLSSGGNIVFLGHPGREWLSILESRLGADYEYRIFEPDWRSADALHQCFRSASHTIFINSFRVLDAACTQCQCTLHTTSDFRFHESVDLLVQVLQQYGCVSYDQTGNSMSSENPAYPFRVATNRLDEARKLLRDSAENSQGSDWLTEFTREPVLPVIGSYNRPVKLVLKELRDRRTRIMRKSVKLMEDPRAFFVDSNQPLVRKVLAVYERTRKAS